MGEWLDQLCALGQGTSMKGKVEGQILNQGFENGHWGPSQTKNSWCSYG